MMFTFKSTAAVSYFVLAISSLYYRFGNAEVMFGDWVQLGTDIGTGGYTDSVTVSANGAIIAVGYRYGLVRMLKSDASDQYIPFGSDISCGAQLDVEYQYQYTTFVTMSADGSTVAIALGTFKDRVNREEKGSICVYKLDSTSDQYILIKSEVTDVNKNVYGRAMVMSNDGTILVVGETIREEDIVTGTVRAFKTDSSANVTTQILSNGRGRLGFGYSLSMSADGTFLVVGESNNSGDTPGVRAYKFDSINNNYTQFGLDIIGESGDPFGKPISVAISSEGSTIAISTSEKYFSFDTVSVYQLDPSNRYKKIGSAVDRNGNEENSFGRELAISTDGTTFVASGVRFKSFGDDVFIRKEIVLVFKFDFSVNDFAQVGWNVDFPRFTDDVDISADGTIIVISGWNSVRVMKYSPTATRRTKEPTRAPSPAPCGLFGWNIFCFRPGDCGFFRRLLFGC